MFVFCFKLLLQWPSTIPNTKPSVFALVCQAFRAWLHHSLTSLGSGIPSASFCLWILKLVLCEWASLPWTLCHPQQCHSDFKSNGLSDRPSFTVLIISTSHSCCGSLCHSPHLEWYGSSLGGLIYVLALTTCALCLQERQRLCKCCSLWSLQA